MSFITKMQPGLIGALFAYISLKALMFMDFGSMEAEIIVFFVVYVVVATLAEKALAKYGTTSGQAPEDP